MEVNRATLEQIYDDIVNSAQWKLPWPVGPHPTDKNKALRRRRGEPASVPSGRLARAAWRVAAVLTPLAQPPPPPPYKKVAPRVAYKQDFSDALFSLTTDGVTLRPGVYRRADGKYSDDSGAVYTTLDGRDESGIRSDGPAVTGAKEIDGRNLWDLPLMGEPTKNTGSWLV